MGIEDHILEQEMKCNILYSCAKRCKYIIIIHRCNLCSAQVDPEEMTSIQQQILSLVPNLDSRIAMEYTITLGSVLTVQFSDNSQYYGMPAIIHFIVATRCDCIEGIYYITDTIILYNYYGYNMTYLFYIIIIILMGKLIFYIVSTFLFVQIAAAMNDHIVSTSDIFSTFESTFVPIIQKYQVKQTRTPIAKYLLALAKAAPISEVIYS